MHKIFSIFSFKFTVMDLGMLNPFSIPYLLVCTVEYCRNVKSCNGSGVTVLFSSMSTNINYTHDAFILLNFLYIIEDLYTFIPHR